jgi:uncharacterized membrane protein
MSQALSLFTPSETPETLNNRKKLQDEINTKVQLLYDNEITDDFNDIKNFFKTLNTTDKKLKDIYDDFLKNHEYIKDDITALVDSTNIKKTPFFIDENFLWGTINGYNNAMDQLFTMLNKAYSKKNNEITMLKKKSLNNVNLLKKNVSGLKPFIDTYSSVNTITGGNDFTSTQSPYISTGGVIGGMGMCMIFYRFIIIILCSLLLFYILYCITDTCKKRYNNSNRIIYQI